MKKLIIQLLITVFLFFATWQVLAQIDWIEILEIEQYEKDRDELISDNTSDLGFDNALI